MALTDDPALADQLFKAFEKTIGAKDATAAVNQFADAMRAMGTRRHGKTQLTQQLMQAMSDGPLRGTELSGVFIDEATDLPLETYRDPAVPAATLTIHLVDGKFQVRHGERDIGEPFLALPIAKAKAKDLHERLVAGVIAKRQEQNPLYGRF
jgi:hypothetical protein